VVQNIVMNMSVCLFIFRLIVSLLAYLENYRSNFTEAPSFSGGVAICHVLTVLYL